MRNSKPFDFFLISVRCYELINGTHHLRARRGGKSTYTHNNLAQRIPNGYDSKLLKEYRSISLILRHIAEVCSRGWLFAEIHFCHHIGFLSVDFG